MSPLTAIEEFEQIIRHQGAQELVPFLLVLDKKDVVAVREKLKSLRNELDRQDESNGWKAAITSEQEEMLQLAAIVTFAQAQVLHPPMRFWFDKRYEHKSEFWQVMEYARPSWLAELLLPRARSLDNWGVPLYSFLRKLEQRQLLKFEPELFTKALPNWLSELGHLLSQTEPVSTDANALATRLIAEDPTLLNRDLLLLFEFATHIEKERCRVQKRPAPTEDWTGRWQQWNQLHPPQSLDWHEVFVRLVTANHLDRADILTRCLLALRRDFRRPLLTWFKELFLSLKPSLTERLARQAELVELLAHPLPLVVNFAIEQLKDMWMEPGFTLAPMLLYADNLLTRTDLKTGLKTLLAGLAKLLKHDAAHAPIMGRLFAAALSHPDSAVQERAAKGLAELLNVKKPLLTADETAAVITAIGEAADLLSPSARAVLGPWLEAAPASQETRETVGTYAPLSDFVPDISAATAIAPVADWHELLFLTGQVMKHDDPAALERWLDGLLRLQGQLPTDYPAQLRPYLVQLLPALKKAGEDERMTLLAGPIRLDGHEALAPALLLSWATGFAVAQLSNVQVQGDFNVRTPLLPVEKQRYLHAETLLRAQRPLPLLSTPTHEPYWVAPSQLISRLLVYETAGLEPDVADLAVALARTAHAHPAEATEALCRLPQLHHTELRELLTWFLGAAISLPAPVKAPPRRAAQLPATLTQALPELWAVAARTKAPQQLFPTLPNRLGYDHVGAAEPLFPTLNSVPRVNTYQEISAPGQPTISYHWIELQWGNSAISEAPSPLLLYSPPGPRSEHGSWEHNILFAGEFLFLDALLPNYPAPLHEYILRCAAWADNLEATERDLVAQGLRSLLGPGPAYAPAGLFLLASGLIHHTPLCRRLAQEALVRAIAHGRLVPGPLGYALGRQLAVGYAPVPRLADNLRPLCGIDALTDDALRQTLEALLPELPAEPPRNLRKLLEVYADLIGRTRQPVTAGVRERVREWQAATSIKKVATALLAEPKT
ncbi:DUF6493 family protein [Hymenobacter terrenus]|uniref:DUF6493 family protein n=1 Tax=Hymenobacter terrenus TaxID=1629124 RepID=UPI0006197755|nr:DUF6493 family protein [Hymenobacter terrenus]